MIKPEAVEAGYTGAILNKIEKSGFRIVSLKKVILSKERAGQFYEVHRERPFYGELVEYMSSGPIIAAILEKDNAIAVSLNKVPEIPFIKINGKKTAINISVVAIIAKVICLEPLYAATNGVSPFSILV